MVSEFTATLPRKSAKHLPALDGLRGLAVLGVLIVHLSQASGQTDSRFVRMVFLLVLPGSFGVDLFFVLSGFLITGILLDTIDTPSYLRNFYGRRAVRIFPLYYGVLLLYLVYELIVHEGPLAQLWVLFGYLSNTPLWMTVPHSALLSNGLGHYWTLAVEEQFYLVWPFMVYLLHSRRRVMIAASIMILISPGIRALVHFTAYPGMTWHAMYCRTDSLLAGAWVAGAWRGPEHMRAQLLRWAPFAFTASLAAVVFGIYLGNVYINATSLLTETIGWSFLAVLFASLIAMTLREGSHVERVFKNRSLRYFGRYSYGLYVLHRVVITALEGSLGLWLHRYLINKVAYHAVWFLVVLGLSLGLAVLSFKFYETPFLKLKRNFEYKPQQVELSPAKS